MLIIIYDEEVIAINRLKTIYEKLLGYYGELNWWPAQTPYEVMAGAILTQNTAWSNVEKAIANFDGNLTPEFIENVSFEDLYRLIRPSGFFKQKGLYLKEMTQWFKKYDYSPDMVRLHPLETVRKELLAVKGIGFETADSILLYAFSYPTFVVDAYTKRLLERLPIYIKYDYSSIKAYFEKELPPEASLYNNFHALIVINAKNHCKKNPVCLGCPLKDDCAQYQY